MNSATLVTPGQERQMVHVVRQKKTTKSAMNQLLSTRLFGQLVDAANQTDLYAVDPFKYLEALHLPRPNYLTYQAVYLKSELPEVGPTGFPFYATEPVHDEDVSGFNRWHQLAVDGNYVEIKHVAEMFREKQIQGATRRVLQWFVDNHPEITCTLPHTRIIGLGSYSPPVGIPGDIEYLVLNYRKGLFDGFASVRGCECFRNGSDWWGRDFFLAALPQDKELS